MENEGSSNMLNHSENIFTEGLHIRHIFNDDEERLKTIAKFYMNGLTERNRMLCIVDTISPHNLTEELKNPGIDTGTHKSQFITADNVSCYYRNGKFDPKSVLDSIRAFWNQVHLDGFSGARVRGDM